LLGGALAVMEFGPLCQWMNSYWGGAFPAMAGCLVFGALPRLRREPRLRDGVLLAVGLGIHWITRPYESIFLFLAVVLFFAPSLRRREELRKLAKLAPEAAIILATTAAVTLFHDKSVTGQWLTMPEQLSQYEYGVPAALTFQPDPIPHHELTPQQAMDYKMQLGFRGQHAETLGSYMLRLEYRVRYYRFFFYPPLYLALAAFLVTLREYRWVWVALTGAMFALGVNFFPAFQLHYVAAITCLFVLISVAGLARMGTEAARILAFLCVAQFAFWYGLHVFDNSGISKAMRTYETWDSINHGNPERRIYIRQQLDQIPGKLLVFVRYAPQHMFQDEWVYNRADIDGSRIVWARDLGPDEDARLLQYYADRAAYLLEPDFRTPRLGRYGEATK
jgi:hypothetical protein